MTMIIVVALFAALFAHQVNCGKDSKRIAELTKKLAATYDKIEYLNATVNTLRAQTREVGGTYVRWGRTTCDGDAKVVYDGYTAGSDQNQPGSGSNYICLPREPKWGQYNDKIEPNMALLHGVEYRMAGDHYNHDAPCVVCRTLRSNVLMIPGTNECQDGWVLEYWGYLVAQAYFQQSKEFVCLDKDFEDVDSDATINNGGLFYKVEGRCRSLRCPPYVDGRELACVVCSYGKRG